MSEGVADVAPQVPLTERELSEVRHMRIPFVDDEVMRLGEKDYELNVCEPVPVARVVALPNFARLLRDNPERMRQTLDLLMQRADADLVQVMLEELQRRGAVPPGESERVRTKLHRDLAEFPIVSQTHALRLYRNTTTVAKCKLWKELALLAERVALESYVVELLEMQRQVGPRKFEPGLADLELAVRLGRCRPHSLLEPGPAQARKESAELREQRDAAQAELAELRFGAEVLLAPSERVAAIEVAEPALQRRVEELTNLASLAFRPVTLHALRLEALRRIWALAKPSPGFFRVYWDRPDAPVRRRDIFNVAFAIDTLFFDERLSNVALVVAVGKNSGRYLGHAYYDAADGTLGGLRQSLLPLLGVETLPQFSRGLGGRPFANLLVDELLRTRGKVSVHLPSSPDANMLRLHPEYCNRCSDEDYAVLEREHTARQNSGT